MMLKLIKSRPNQMHLQLQCEATRRHPPLQSGRAGGDATLLPSLSSQPPKIAILEHNGEIVEPFAAGGGIMSEFNVHNVLQDAFQKCLS